MTLTCRKVAEILIDFVEGSLSEDQHTLLQRHLCGCVPCAIYIHTYRDTIKVTHSLPDEPLPTEFAGRLKKMLEEAAADKPDAQ
ncbi:MAG TPA: zf-HC2 domain-containing protein [Gemmataceae bacterium]|jgi:anti-sigma factor RsiW|nr:zf-HC2 domain-containing protein [Gemmataceae bacterium]